MDNNESQGFSSRIAVFFAALSSAVGLGNIWLFPYKTGENGGAAFIITYLICTAIIAFPLMIGEYMIGRHAKKDVLGSIEAVTDKKVFRLMAIFGIISSYLVLFFYTTVAGWIFSYVLKSITGVVSSVDINSVTILFNNTTVGPVTPIVWQGVVILTVCIISMLGVKNGIEKATKILMPILLVLLIICAAKSLTLSGVGDGLKFLFKPDFSKITFSVFVSALSLAFFKLGVGMGTLITYGSYFTEDSNLPGTARNVIISDVLVSIFAGIIIFPAVFTFGLKTTSGPSLLFETVPLIFSNMPGGHVLAILFFLLTAFAATTASLALFQVIVAYFVKKRNWSNKKAVIVNGMIVFLFGILATLSANTNGMLSSIKIFGYTFFDLFNQVTSTYLLPVSGLLIAILIGYYMDKKIIKEQLSQSGEKFIKVYIFLLRYVTPVLIMVMFLTSVI